MTAALVSPKLFLGCMSHVDERAGAERNDVGEGGHEAMDGLPTMVCSGVESQLTVFEFDESAYSF